MNRCCGKQPIMKTYKERIKCYWLECPNCHRRTSYSYDNPKEAQEAWNKGIVSKPMFERR